MKKRIAAKVSISSQYMFCPCSTPDLPQPRMAREPRPREAVAPGLAAICLSCASPSFFS